MGKGTFASGIPDGSRPFEVETEALFVLLDVGLNPGLACVVLAPQTGRDEAADFLMPSMGFVASACGGFPIFDLLGSVTFPVAAGALALPDSVSERTMFRAGGAGLL